MTYLFGCLTGFMIGAGLTLWTLNRIGKRLQRKAREAAAHEQTMQFIRWARHQHVKQN